MKKILLAVMAILFIRHTAVGQVTLQPVMPVAGLIQKNQLWNVLVINSTRINYRCMLRINLKDRASGMDVLTASAGQFDLAPGTRQLNINQLNPVQYNYLLAGMDNRLQGLLPAGSYTACYELVSITAAKAENLAEECIQFDAEPLSPPMLIFPADSSLLESIPNQFSWVPPTPQGMFDRLRYELLITEIKEGQKAAEALQDNIPFYNDGTLFTNNMTYPPSAAIFEKEKWYAWQVTARDERAYAGKSEVWVFKIGKPTVKVNPVNDVYLLLQNDVQGAYQINTRVLHIKYFSGSSDHETQIIFSDEKGNVIKTVQQKVIRGDNYFDFTLNNQFNSNSVYKVTLADKSNKTHTLTFSINTK